MDIVSTTLRGSVNAENLERTTASTNQETLSLVLSTKETAKKEFKEIMAEEISASNKNSNYRKLDSAIKFKLGILYLIMRDDSEFNLHDYNIISILRSLLLDNINSVIATLQEAIDENLWDEISEIYDEALELYYSSNNRASLVVGNNQDYEVYRDYDAVDAVSMSMSHYRAVRV